MESTQNRAMNKFYSALLLSFVGTVCSHAHPASSDLVDLPLEQLLQFDISNDPPPERLPSPGEKNAIEVVDPDPVIDLAAKGIVDGLPAVSRIGIGYRFIAARYERHQEGRREVSAEEVLGRYGRVMTRMDVEANVFSLGYRANENWMVHLSVPFLRMAGDVESLDENMFSLAVEGVSDLEVNISRYFHLDPQTQVALNLGIGVPTGSIDMKRRGSLLPYSIQLGSGTWDLSPGIAAVRETGRFELGASVETDIHLGNNSRGYSSGNAVAGTMWVDYSVNPHLEFGVFVRGFHLDGVEAFMQEGKSALHWNPGNYGGDFVEGGLSVRLLHPSCPYGGKFLEIRASRPLWRNANGIHLVNDWTLDLGIGISF